MKFLFKLRLIKTILSVILSLNAITCIIQIEKMRIFVFLLLVSTSMMISCSSTEDLGPIENPGPVEVDLVHSEMIRLWNGTSCRFEAIEDGEYNIKSEDPLIAKVKVEGKVFTVVAGRPGETNISITDNAGNETVIKCYSRAFDGYWAEETLLQKLYKNSINVFARDKSVATLIKDELKAQNADNIGLYVYRFTQDSDELVVSGGNLIMEQGTYKWDFDNRMLTLNYDGNTEKYSVDVMPQYPNMFIIYPLLRFILAITRDYTEEYKQKYPDAGIEEVFVIRHMISRADYWRTERKTE